MERSQYVTLLLHSIDNFLLFVILEDLHLFLTKQIEILGVSHNLHKFILFRRYRKHLLFILATIFLIHLMSSKLG